MTDRQENRLKIFLLHVFAVVFLIATPVSTSGKNVHESEISLELGDAFVLEKPNRTRIKTNLGVIDCAEKSTVFVLATEKSVSVFNFDSIGNRDVQLEAGAKIFSVTPGMQLVITKDLFATFREVNPGLGIAYKNPRRMASADSLNVFSAEFSIPSAFKVLAPLSDLLDSKRPEDKKLVRRLLRNAAILGSTSSASRPTAHHAIDDTVLKGRIDQSVNVPSVLDMDKSFEQLIDLRIARNQLNPTLNDDVQLLRQEDGSWKDVPSQRMNHSMIQATGNSSAVVMCSRDTLIITNQAIVIAKKGAVLFVIDSGMELVVYVLGAGGTRETELFIDNKVVRLRPGELLLSTEEKETDFSKRVAHFGIGHRAPTSTTIGQKTVFVSEFSIPAASCILPPIRRITLSERSEDVELARNILKSAAILHDITMSDGPYKAR